MNSGSSTQADDRLLLLVPTSRDAQLSSEILGRAGVACTICPGLDELPAALDRKVASLLIAEEIFARDHRGLLVSWLARQEPWSDLPIILLARPGTDSETLTRAVEQLSNVTVIDRPTRIATLVSVARSAIRARRRQYQLREHLILRERTETQLRETVEEVRTLLDTLPIGVVMTFDTEASDITGNARAHSLLRVRAGEKFDDVRVFDGETEIPFEHHPLTRAARGDNVVAEHVDLHIDDTVIHAMVWATPLRNVRGEPRGALAAILDLTEQRRAEVALRESDRRKDEFLAILAHELRNPLAPVRTALDILKRETEPSTRQNLHEIIERQVETMVRLVNDLLDVSRIARGTTDLDEQIVDLRQIVHSAIEISQPLIVAGRHRLTTRLPPQPVRMRADPVRLAQVFANLLNNAAKYTPVAGEIAIRVDVSDDQARIVIEDDGIGIAKEMLTEVFDMFRQIREGGQKPSSGLGIGLTLVKRLVEQHQGTVVAESDGIGLGSRFIVRLPLTQVDGPAKTFPQSDSAFSLRGLRVLVADDNEDAATVLKQLIQILGGVCSVVNDGDEVLDALRAGKPSVAILDIGMPHQDGYTVARRIRALPEFDDVVLVALTGWGQEEDKRRSREAGFDFHLVKPAAYDVLKAVLAPLVPAA